MSLAPQVHSQFVSFFHSFSRSRTHSASVRSVGRKGGNEHIRHASPIKVIKLIKLLHSCLFLFSTFDTLFITFSICKLSWCSVTSPSIDFFNAFPLINVWCRMVVMMTMMVVVHHRRRWWHRRQGSINNKSRQHIWLKIYKWNNCIKS